MISGDRSQVRCHSEFNADENEAVRDKTYTLYSGTHRIKVLDHVIVITHNNF